MKKALYLVGVLLLLAATAVRAASEDQGPAPGVKYKPVSLIKQETADIPLLEDVVYGKGGDVELKMDIASPREGEGPFPAIICIHGGGWISGDKNGERWVTKMLAAEGYVAATVSYRLLPKYGFPAQIEDVKCAVRYLRAHAKELKIDTNRMGVCGGSAGGHLSLLLGLMDPDDGLEGTGGNNDQSSQVHAIVNFCGPTDLKTWQVWPICIPFIKQDYGTDVDGVYKMFTGSSDRNSEEVAKASPITYVDPDDPPVLTVHGAMDPLVPVQQAKVLHEALKKADVEERLVILKNAIHGWDGEDLDYTVYLTTEFFNRHLKGCCGK